MKPRLLNRRRFITASGSALAASHLVAAEHVPDVRNSIGIIDCQSHQFFPEVIQLMRRRKTEPLVYDQDGVAILKMGDWLRKVPPPYTSVEAKLAAMDASGIEMTLLSTNDPGPEWFGEEGPVVAQLIHDSLAGVMANPFYLDLGFTLAQIANVSGIYGVAMTIAGGVLGGVLVPRDHRQRARRRLRRRFRSPRARRSRRP